MRKDETTPLCHADARAGDRGCFELTEIIRKVLSRCAYVDRDACGRAVCVFDLDDCRSSGGCAFARPGEYACAVDAQPGRADERIPIAPVFVYRRIAYFY